MKKKLRNIFIELYTIYFKILKLLNIDYVVSYYYSPPLRKKNFGDNLNHLVIRFFNRRIINYSYLKNYSGKVVFLIGSTLNSIKDIPLRNDIFVFGSGNHYNFPNENHRPINPNYICVRGLLSKDNLKLSNEVNSKIKLGDLGLILSIIFPQKNINKVYNYSILPHFSQYKTIKRYKPIIKKTGGILVSPHWPPIKIIKILTKSKQVFSSSLHGLIVSDSYNIPNTWTNFVISSNKNLIRQIDSFKFYDYYSTFNNSPKPYLFDLENINQSLSMKSQQSNYYFEQINNIKFNLYNDFKNFIKNI